MIRLLYINLLQETLTHTHTSLNRLTTFFYLSSQTLRASRLLQSAIYMHELWIHAAISESSIRPLEGRVKTRKRRWQRLARTPYNAAPSQRLIQSWNIFARWLRYVSYYLENNILWHFRSNGSERGATHLRLRAGYTWYSRIATLST